MNSRNELAFIEGMTDHILAPGIEQTINLLISFWKHFSSDSTIAPLEDNDIEVMAFSYVLHMYALFNSDLPDELKNKIADRVTAKFIEDQSLEDLEGVSKLLENRQSEYFDAVENGRGNDFATRLTVCFLKRFSLDENQLQFIGSRVSVPIRKSIPGDIGNINRIGAKAGLC